MKIFLQKQYITYVEFQNIWKPNGQKLTPTSLIGTKTYKSQRVYGAIQAEVGISTMVDEPGTFQ